MFFTQILNFLYNLLGFVSFEKPTIAQDTINFFFFVGSINKILFVISNFCLPEPLLKLQKKKIKIISNDYSVDVYSQIISAFLTYKK